MDRRIDYETRGKITQAAKLLGVSENQVRNMTKGEVDAIIARGAGPTPNQLKAEVRKVGQEFGVNVERSDAHLLRILRSEKYGGNPDLATLADITADEARTILQTRDASKTKAVAAVKGADRKSDHSIRNRPNQVLRVYI